MSRISSIRTRPTTTGFLVQRALVANLTRLIVEGLASRPAGILIDVGCGNSPYGELLPGWRRVGVNIDAGDANPDVVGDGLQLPFRDACADAVLCTQVVEHVRDPFLLFRELSRVLKPGGVLILSGPMYWPLHEEPHDYWRFTEHGLRQLARQAGLETQSILREGGAVALTAVSINHLFRGPVFLPVRLVVNLAGLALDKIWHITHSSPNLSLRAVKLP